MRLHTLGELGRYNNLRLKAAKKAGQDIPGIGNLSKLAMSDIMRLTRDVGLRIVGPAGMLHAYTDDARPAIEEATGNPFGHMVTGHRAVGAGPADLRRHRSDPAQHHRRAGARAAQGAGRHQERAVLGAAQERCPWSADGDVGYQPRVPGPPLNGPTIHELTHPP